MARVSSLFFMRAEVERDPEASSQVGMCRCRPKAHRLGRAETATAASSRKFLHAWRSLRGWQPRARSAKRRLSWPAGRSQCQGCHWHERPHVRNAEHPQAHTQSREQELLPIPLTGQPAPPAWTRGRNSGTSSLTLGGRYRTFESVALPTTMSTPA